MGEFVEGLEQFKRKVNHILANVQKLDGENEVPLVEVFSAEFMRQHTRVGTFEQLKEAGGFGGMDLAAIPDEAWEATVRAHTSFSSWSEMLEQAGAAWTLKQSLKGLP